MSKADPIKATHYIQQLDNARVEGSWDHVPELVRKVRKHAPERTCLTLTAEAEYSIAQSTESKAPNARSSTALSAKDVTLPQQLPKLLGAIDAENTYAQDRYQGRTAVGWLHWAIGEYELALARLPKSLETEFMTAEPVNLDALSDWTKTCALKAAYLRANCLVRAGQLQDALAVFETTSSFLAPIWNEPSNKKQLGYWTELFLTEYCMVTSQSIKEGKKSLEDTKSLLSFRAWARYWAASRKAQVTAGFGDHGSVPRRRIWLEYYTALSLVLQGDLPYSTDYSQPLAPDSSARSRLRTELKKVEASYEALLLSETTFPRAEEGREDIEEFIALVMQNWSILNGRGWRDADLGPGGRENLNRGVLDVLYRAATKTFHSVSILRSLFLVHLAVAEFDLAFKCFDSYLDLVKRGKARVAKTGHSEPSLDDDAVALETQAVCIAALCRYGDAQAAEKARELALGVDKWLQSLPQPKDMHGDGIAPLKDEANALDAPPKIPLHVLALAWQSIGLANAQWARITHDSTSRTEIQAKAVVCLRKSLSPDFGRPTDLGGVFALAVLLAEQRQLVAALELVKGALLTSTDMSDEQHPLRNGPYWRERCLIPLWHLLALLLSARQDYVMAARACEGAFEQFKDPGILFGTKALNNPYRSDHLNEVEANNEKSFDSGRGVVDEMDDFEKESILEVKLTQLALVELLEGPNVAVNASLELLTLFSRLFGEPQKDKPTLSTESSRTVPKSSAGTIRSITGSIFGSRADRAGRARRSAIDPDQGEKLSSIPSRPQTMQTTTSTVTSNAPAIQVTHENGNGNSSLSDTRRARPSTSLTRREREPRQRNSLRKRDSSAGTRRAVSSGGLPQQSSLLGSESSWARLGDSGAQDFFASSSRVASSSAADSSFTTHAAAPKRRGLGHTESFLSTKSKAGDGSGPAGSGTEGARSFLTLLPPIQFPKDHLQRRRNAILVKLWLMIGGFYRRAGMYDDAKGAIDEAAKLVQRAEIEVGGDAAGTIALKSAGWGGSKSVAELHGDVFAEKGHLSLAQGRPYAARDDFEDAVEHYPDHPAAIVGLSDILLDLYSEKLLPPPAVPPLETSQDIVPKVTASTGSAIAITNGHKSPTVAKSQPPNSPFPSGPLGLRGSQTPQSNAAGPPQVRPGLFNANISLNGESNAALQHEPPLEPPYKAKSLPLIDRLAARDRAYGLLAGLTKLGSAWNYSDAWFALARAHEESGQPDKAKEVLWWCVELEEAMGVRQWSNVSGAGGYVL